MSELIYLTQKVDERHVKQNLTPRQWGEQAYSRSVDLPAQSNSQQSANLQAHNNKFYFL